MGNYAELIKEITQKLNRGEKSDFLSAQAAVEQYGISLLTAASNQLKEPKNQKKVPPMNTHVVIQSMEKMNSIAEQKIGRVLIEGVELQNIGKFAMCLLQQKVKY